MISSDIFEMRRFTFLIFNLYSWHPSADILKIMVDANYSRISRAALQ